MPTYTLYLKMGVLKKLFSKSKISTDNNQSPQSSPPRSVTKKKIKVVSEDIERPSLTGQLGRMITSIVLTIGKLIHNDQAVNLVLNNPEFDSTAEFTAFHFAKVLESLEIPGELWNAKLQQFNVMNYDLIRKEYEKSIKYITEYTREHTKDSIDVKSKELINKILNWADQFVGSRYSEQYTAFSDLISESLELSCPKLRCIARTYNLIACKQLERMKYSVTNIATVANIAYRPFIGEVGLIEFIKSLRKRCSSSNHAIVLTACILYLPYHSSNYNISDGSMSTISNALSHMITTVMNTSTSVVKTSVIVLCKALSVIYSALEGCYEYKTSAAKDYGIISPYLAFITEHADAIHSLSQNIRSEWSVKQFKFVHRGLITTILYTCYLVRKTNSSSPENVISAITNIDHNNPNFSLISTLSSILIRYLKQDDFKYFGTKLVSSGQDIFMGPLAQHRENGLTHLKNMIKLVTQTSADEYVVLESKYDNLNARSYVDPTILPAECVGLSKGAELDSFVKTIMKEVTISVDAINGLNKGSELYAKQIRLPILVDTFPIYPPDLKITDADNRTIWPDRDEAADMDNFTIISNTR